MQFPRWLQALGPALLMASLPLNAQEVKPKPRLGFLVGDTIEVVIVDGRRKTDDYEKIPGALAGALRDAYPSAVVRPLPDSVFYQPARPGIITLKVQLLGYGKGFGIEASAGLGLSNGIPVPVVVPAGKWNGVTVFGVTLFDKRAGKDVKLASTIDRVISKSNTWGYRSGNQAMRESFEEAANALLAYFDGVFLG
jgi:hypothetical protein